MTTYRKVYYLKWGSTEKEFGSTKPTFKQVMAFTELHQPTSVDVTLESKLVEVPNAPVSSPLPPKPKAKRWLK